MAATSQSRKPQAQAAAEARQALAAREPSVAARCRGSTLEPHHVDIIGAGADRARGLPRRASPTCTGPGGALGNGAVTATRFVFGALGYAVPAALVARRRAGAAARAAPAGAPDAHRRHLPDGGDHAGARRRARSGSARGRLPAREFWHAAAFESRGGIVGQAELWVSSHLISTLGARHPRRVPVRRRADPRHRRDARRRDPRDRRGRRRHRAARCERSTDDAARRRRRAAAARPRLRGHASASRALDGRRRASPSRCCRPSPTPPSWSSARRTSRRRRSRPSAEDADGRATGSSEPGRRADASTSDERRRDDAARRRTSTRRPDAAGPLPRVDHRRPRLRVAGAAARAS